MKVMPHFSHILAKDGFSDRKPKPGWIASAPVISQAEITVLSWFRAYADCLVCYLSVESVSVGGGIYSNSMYAKLSAGSYNADSDLASVRYQYFFEHIMPH